MLHALLYNNKLIGLFSDYDKCKILLKGLILNNFVNEKYINIKTFYENTITVCEDYLLDNLDSNTESDESNTDDLDTDDLDSDTKKKLKEERENKSKIQYEIQVLKKKKEKIEESKKVYEVDLNLYNKFKELLNENTNFIIPELFINKYNLMNRLENENKLSWENFYNEYEPEELSTSYSKLFQ